MVGNLFGRADVLKALRTKKLGYTIMISISLAIVLYCMGYLTINYQYKFPIYISGLLFLAFGICLGSFYVNSYRYLLTEESLDNS